MDEIKVLKVEEREKEKFKEHIATFSIIVNGEERLKMDVIYYEKDKDVQAFLYDKTYFNRVTIVSPKEETDPYAVTLLVAETLTEEAWIFKHKDDSARIVVKYLQGDEWKREEIQTEGKKNVV
jgi:hypothetical protein